MPQHPPAHETAPNDAVFELDVRYPMLALLYSLARPLLITADGAEHALRWKQNAVPTALAGVGFRVEVRYFGLRVGKAAWSGPVPARLEYRAPWIVTMRGELGVSARSRGAALIVALAALVIMIPVVFGYLVVSATNEVLEDTAAAEREATQPEEERAEEALAPSDTDRQAALEAATAGLVEVLSVDPRTYDAEVEAAAALMTDAYANEYRSTAESMRPAYERSGAVIVAKAVDSGLTGIDATHASALVFVSQFGDDAGTVDAAPTMYSAVVRVAKTGDAWLVEAIETESPTNATTDPDPDRAAALDAASQFTDAYVSIDYLNFDADVEKVTDFTTGDFRDQFVGRLDQSRTVANDSQTVSVGKVWATGLSEFSDTRATVLAAASATVADVASPEGSKRDYRFRMGLDKVDGDWLVSTLEFVSAN